MAEAPIFRGFEVPDVPAVPLPVDPLGFATDRELEDLRDQIDGQDALDVTRPRWLPALSESRLTAAVQAPKGKPKQTLPLFLSRGNRPVEMGYESERPSVGGVLTSAVVPSGFEVDGVPVETVEYLGPVSIRDADRGVFPAERVLAVGAPGVEFESFTVYPSFFVTGE